MHSTTKEIDSLNLFLLTPLRAINLFLFISKEITTGLSSKILECLKLSSNILLLL